MYIVAKLLLNLMTYICCEHPSGMGGLSPFFTISVMILFGSSAKGASPREATSHIVMAKRQLEEAGKERERDLILHVHMNT